jgi:uncharacterized RDD family membrane protein YckC
MSHFAPEPHGAFGGDNSESLGRSSVQPGSFGARLGALIIDQLVLIPVQIVVWIGMSAAPTKIDTCVVDGDLALCRTPTSTGWLMIGVVWLIAMIAPIAYFVMLQSGRGYTVGQDVANIRIVDYETGGIPSAGKIIGRYFAKILSGIPCMLGYFWMLWDKDKRTWHDMLSGTQIVKK